MSGNNWLDQTLEQVEGNNSSKQNQHSQKPQNILGAVVSQVTGKGSNDHGSTSNVAAANEAAQVQAHAQQQAAHKANEDMVKEMYAPSEKSVHSTQQKENGGEQTESQKAASEFIQEKVEDGMSPEDAQKLYSLRRQLHNEYYQKLISYGKQHGQPEERTAEKVEKEKEQDDRMNLEEQKKKDTPIAVQMGANRSERFPGASG